MTEVIFGVIVISLLLGFALYVVETNKEKAKLINALIAKTPEQMRDLNLADKVKSITPPPASSPDLVPLETLSEDDFEEHIKKELEQNDK